VSQPASTDRTAELRVDLHVHSCHSGFTSTLPVFKSLDCYSTPEEVHRTATSRGMDVVTITDHDSITGCLEWLGRHPDDPAFVIGEEIECAVVDAGIRVHIGAFGLSEALHRDVQSLRGDVQEATAFLRANGVALVLHHPFHFFRGQWPVERYLEHVLPLVDAVETRNGTMLSHHNALAEACVARWRSAHQASTLGRTGGSDAHVRRHVGDTFTILTPPSAADAQEDVPARVRAVRALRAGGCRAAGTHSTTVRFAVEIYGVVFNYWGGLIGMRRSGLRASERLVGAVYSVASLPFQLAPFIVSLAQKAGERRRVARWKRELQTPTSPRPV
jgi:predicted metal-dependent phosphoesterase TrpH